MLNEAFTKPMVGEYLFRCMILSTIWGMALGVRGYSGITEGNVPSQLVRQEHILRA